MTVQSVIGFFAHPDDETGLAGVIALLSQQRVRVQVVCATRGEGGEVGEPPVVQQRAELGAAREAELRCAVQHLGASLTVLDYVDPTVGEDDVLRPFEADFDQLAAQFASLITRHAANVVLTHGADGEYGHPAHQLVHRATLAAAQYVAKQRPGLLVYTVSALVPGVEDRLWNRNEQAHLALDIRPWAEPKIAALECHRSQWPLFLRNTSARTVREALHTVESVRRAFPPVEPGDSPQDAFADLLRTAGAWTVTPHL